MISEYLAISDLHVIDRISSQYSIQLILPISIQLLEKGMFGISPIDIYSQIKNFK